MLASLGTWIRVAGQTSDTIKAKLLQDGSILVTHTSSFDGAPLPTRETIKTEREWLRQYDRLRDTGFVRVGRST